MTASRMINLSAIKSLEGRAPRNLRVKGLQRGRAGDALLAWSPGFASTIASCHGNLSAPAGAVQKIAATRVPGSSTLGVGNLFVELIASSVCLKIDCP